MYKNLDPYQICTLERLLFQIPLGFSAENEVHGLDLRFYVVDLQIYSEFKKKIHKKKIDYTKEKEEKGQTLISGRMKGKEFSKTLFQTLHELKGEIKEIKRARHEGPSRRYLHEENPSSSSYICKHLAT